MVSSNVTLPFAETIHHTTESNEVQLDDDISFPPIATDLYIDDWELFPPLTPNLESAEEIASCDSRSTNSFVWIGHRTFAEVAIHSGIHHQPISTLSLYTINKTKQQTSKKQFLTKKTSKRQCNNQDDASNNYVNGDIGRNDQYYITKCIQLKKRNIASKINHHKSKTLEIAYRRRINFYFKHQCHHYDKRSTSLYEYYKNSLLETQEELKLCKELLDRLPPRYYFSGRAGTKKAHFIRLNKYGRLDIKDIWDKKVIQQSQHLKQINQEMKDPRIRQLMFDTIHRGAKKIYWMAPWTDPNLWGSEANFVNNRYLGIYVMLGRHWIPYLESWAIPHIQECCRKDQRKLIRRLAQAFPTTSSYTKQFLKASHLQYARFILKEWNC